MASTLSKLSRNVVGLLLRGAIAALLLAGLLSISSARAESAISFDAFWEKVEKTRSVVAGLEGQPQDVVRVTLWVEAIKWESVTKVVLPNGVEVPVNTRYLSASLREETPDLKRLEALLGNLLAAREGGELAAGSEDNLSALERVLAQPEFQWREAQPNPVSQSIQDFVDRLRRAFLDFLTGIGELGAGMGGALPAIVSAILLGILFFFIFRGAFGDMVSEAELLEDGQEGEAITASSALQRAQGLSMEGDYRSAVRYLYLSALLLLEDRGLLRYDRSKTNREYLGSLIQRPVLAARLREVVEVFDRVWYGFRPIDSEAYARYAERVASLKEGE